MVEWLVEDGIGERRAALVDGARLLEMRIEWDDDPPPRAGAIARGRLIRRADATGRGSVRLEDGTDLLLAPVPAGTPEGAWLIVEIVREALPEAGGLKPPRARPAAADAPLRAGPDLVARLDAGPVAVRRLDLRAGGLDAVGWFDALEEAASGVLARPECLLRISLTPAMTLIDVDGTFAPAELAVAGAGAAGAAIRRFGLAGSIGIDLPTLAGRVERQAAAAALDAALPPPFERTAVNGFGFLQLVRRRERRSVMERVAADPAGAAARALLARAGRASGAGPATLAAHPAIVDRIAKGPGWVDQLAKGLGASVALHADPRLAISAGHVARLHP